MTAPTIADILKYADLQMAAEAFLVDSQSKPLTGDLYKQALIDGNKHASKFTEIHATNFLTHWEVLAQRANTPTGFSGTLFKCIQDDPTTGAKAGELVMSIRSTEFIDDAARDNMMSNTLELKNTGWAWGQIRVFRLSPIAFTTMEPTQQKCVWPLKISRYTAVAWAWP